MCYLFGILMTDTSAEAKRCNDSLLGPKTLGIEITIPCLAMRCGLGNIDPQHKENGESSAIEEALTSPLPPKGSILVTIRADKDSIGAMAVFFLRAQGKDIDEKLVRWIGLSDSIGFNNAITSGPDHSVIKKTRAIQDVIHKSGKDLSLAEKVMITAKIISGIASDEEIEILLCPAKSKNGTFHAEIISGNVAFIEAPGKYIQARDWGNRRYTVAIIFDPEFPGTDGNYYGRWSLVVQQNSGFDRQGFEYRINIAEAKARKITVTEAQHQGFGWGGPKNIVSSPQGKPSFLSKRTIFGIAIDCSKA